MFLVYMDYVYIYMYVSTAVKYSWNSLSLVSVKVICYSLISNFFVIT